MSDPRKALVVLTGILLALSATVASAQTAAGSTSVVQTWSSGKVLVTGSGPAVAAAARKDPRVRQSLTLRSTHPTPARGITPASGTPVEWAMSLGSNTTSRGVAEGEFPAKFTSSLTPAFPASCTNDFIVYTVSTPNGFIPAAGKQANLVAFNNLYTGANGSSCPNGPGAAGNATTPSFLFSYAADDGGIFLSPELSLDGKKVAFVVSSVSRHRAIFEVLTWTAGQGTNATTGAVAPTPGSMVSLDFTNGRVPGCKGLLTADDFGSSPYVDYATDSAFVGANNGRMYHISGVFNGTPAVDWCTIVTTNSQLTSPVYDAQHGKVYISDGAKVFSYTFNSATGFSLANSIQVGANKGYTTPSIVDSVAIDPFNGWVYTAAAADVTNSFPVISQMPLDLSSHTDLPIGTTPATGYVLGANFDNGYLSNGPASGNLYACGVAPGSATIPALYAGNFGGNGALNTTATLAGNTNVNASPTTAGHCSPIVTIFDGTTDRLYVGTGNGTTPAGSNLLTMWNITSPITSTAAPWAAEATNMQGGTSAFVVDYLKNATGDPGTNGVYFGTRAQSSTSQCGAKNFCAIKVAQDTLQ